MDWAGDGAGDRAGQWARRRLLIAGVAGLLGAALVGPGQTYADAGAIGRVERLEGRVFLQRDGILLSLRQGNPIFAADEITTQQGAKLQIRLNDGSLLVLGGATKICLEDVALPTQEAPGRGLVVMGDGILRLILKGGGAWDGFSVDSSTSVASVRGTDFVVESAPERSAVFVLTGLVEVGGKAGGHTRLSAGQGSTVPLDAPATRGKRWGARRVTEMMAKVQVTP